MNLILFDDKRSERFYPFALTRPMADIRCGILTMRARWEACLSVVDSSSLVRENLSNVFPAKYSEDNLYINGGLVSTKNLVDTILNLQPGNGLQSADGTILALRSKGAIDKYSEDWKEEYNFKTFEITTTLLNNVWDIFSLNGTLIQHDFELLTKERRSQPFPDYITTIVPENIFIEEGAIVGPCIINASEGPVYIGRDAEIMEGCLIRGPLALCEHATLKMGAKVYGATTIGPHCKVGGEVNNAVFFNYSNKGHDGFIGNAVIGDWCNLGADTNCSNLKNNYDIVKIWNNNTGKMQSTDLQFCGLLMGDHSKCGINTMFNTGTIVGVSCNIFGAGFPDKHIPSFTWGGIQDNQIYELNKAIETADRMMQRRGKSLSEADKELLTKLFNNETNPLKNI